MIFKLLYLFIPFISIAVAYKQLWKILFIILYISNQFYFLMNKLYFIKKFQHKIKLNKRNINMRQYKYLNIQLLISIINKKRTYQ